MSDSTIHSPAFQATKHHCCRTGSVSTVAASLRTLHPICGEVEGRGTRSSGELGAEMDGDGCFSG